MERIQRAIAKARATRDGEDAEAPAKPRGATGNAKGAKSDAAATKPTESEARDRAWAALTPFEPNEKRLKKARIVSFMGGSAAASFDVMRTKTLQTMRANNWTRLAITSPTPACGKSTITLNLGFSLSRQPEVRTIISELDLRRPSLTKTLNASPTASFPDVLSGHASFAEQALCHNGNLALSLTTKPERNPAELLHASVVPERLREIEDTYAPDLTIFDMPPMLASDDMMAFAGHVDCVLLVAGAESTSIKEIDSCERELANQTNFMGVILNKCRYMGDEYGYSYYG